MSIKGYVDYQRREYCKDIKCEVQAQLDTQKPDTKEYNKARQRCKYGCIHTTYEFHHWLIENKYLVIKKD